MQQDFLVWNDSLLDNAAACVCVCVCVLSPFDCAFEVWLADGVVVYEDCGTGAVFLWQWTRRHLRHEIRVLNWLRSRIHCWQLYLDWFQLSEWSLMDSCVHSLNCVNHSFIGRIKNNGEVTLPVPERDKLPANSVWPWGCSKLITLVKEAKQRQIFSYQFCRPSD